MYDYKYNGDQHVFQVFNKKSVGQVICVALDFTKAQQVVDALNFQERTDNPETPKDPVDMQCTPEDLSEADRARMVAELFEAA